LASRLPNLLYLGADKSGSTFLHHLLGLHEDVFVAPAKDTYYFTDWYSKGSDWYGRRFSGAPGDVRFVAEVCHDYLYSHEAALRIRRDLGSPMLLVGVREPFARAWSAFLNLRRAGLCRVDFRSALEVHPALVDHGRYSHYIANWQELFPDDPVRILWFGQMVRDPKGFARELFVDHLGISEPVLGHDDLRARNEASDPRNLLVARIGKAGARSMRRIGSPELLASMKHSPRVRALVYRSTVSPDLVPTDDDRAEFRWRLGDEASRMTSLLGHPPDW
jgi:hypothetical protein